MRANARMALSSGSLAGLAFFFSAFVPRSFAFSLVWPLIAGARVIFWNSRSIQVRSGFWRDVRISSAAGMAAAVVFVGLGTIANYIFAGGSLEQAFKTFGVSISTIVDRAFFVNLIIISVATMPCAAVAGGLLVRWASRRSRTRATVPREAAC